MPFHVSYRGKKPVLFAYGMILESDKKMAASEW